MQRRTVVLGTIFLLSIVIIVFLGIPTFERRWEIASRKNIELPLPEEQVAISSFRENIQSSRSSIIRASVNWDVPFTSQAPHAVWDPLHQEACEEASSLMVLRYFNRQKIIDSEDAESAIQNLVAINESLGFPVDSTAEQVMALLHSQDADLSVSLLKDPTEERMKKELSEGKLIIVPAAGRSLKNPYYTAPGPLYHMLVIRGYTTDGKYVITNDPGTKRGEQFTYTWDRLLAAIHDWNNGDPDTGDRVVLSIGKDR